MILNRAKYYHENDKERLREQARDKYRNLSEEEKTEKREYGKKQIPKYVWTKKTKIKIISKKLLWGKKSPNVIMNKIVFFNCDLIVYALI